jgi:hypothetical protein
MVGGLGGRSGTCSASNGGWRSCGGLDDREKCLGQENKRQFKRAGQGFEGVWEGRKSHGWEGTVGGDRGKRRVQ